MTPGSQPRPGWRVAAALVLAAALAVARARRIEMWLRRGQRGRWRRKIVVFLWRGAVRFGIRRGRL